MQLRPEEKFTIVRQLADPFDTDTYYVQAKVRDAFDDELLATLSLTNKGSQRFTGLWRVCDDPSGLGRWIDIETIVYTDAGHTAVSENYKRENAVYLVEERLQNLGGGGADVDYGKIEKIVSQVARGGKGGKGGDKSLDELKRLLLNIGKKVEGIEMPEEKEFDIEGPINKAVTRIGDMLDGNLGEIKGAIDAKEVTEVDLAPVLSAISEMDQKVPEVADIVRSALTELARMALGDAEKFNAGIEDIKRALAGISFTATYSSNVKEKEPEVEDEPALPIRRRRIQQYAKK